MYNDYHDKYPYPWHSYSGGTVGNIADLHLTASITIASDNYVPTHNSHEILPKQYIWFVELFYEW